jgi:hypothetical protein
MYTRKDFQAIAENLKSIREAGKNEAFHFQIKFWIEKFSASNKRFSEEKFLQAVNG